MIVLRCSRKLTSGRDADEGMPGNGMRVLPESEPLERERTPLVWHLRG